MKALAFVIVMAVAANGCATVAGTAIGGFSAGAANHNIDEEQAQWEQLHARGMTTEPPPSPQRASGWTRAGIGALVGAALDIAFWAYLAHEMVPPR